MANSLRAKLSKLRHNRHITEEEYQAFIKKLDGHDRQIRVNAIDECINKLYEVTPQTYDEKLDMVFVNALEQLKEQKNE